ncbi:MAG TPA: hypothetical protein VGG34_06205 [Opitutaceae bacterium]
MIDTWIQGYPNWLVTACSLLVAIFVLWVILKLLKIALWILFYFIIAAGLVSLVLYFFG